MFHPMKPETIERRRRERAKEQKKRKEDHLVYLREAAERDPEGIWQELIEEHLDRNPWLE